MLREAVLTAKRYGSKEARRAGLIDGESPVEDLLQRAQELANEGIRGQSQLLRFNPKAFSQVKMELYTDAYRALTMGSHSTPSHSRL